MVFTCDYSDCENVATVHVGNEPADTHYCDQHAEVGLRKYLAAQHHAHADGACPHANTINPLGRVFCPDCRNLVTAPQVA